MTALHISYEEAFPESPAFTYCLSTPTGDVDTSVVMHEREQLLPQIQRALGVERPAAGLYEWYRTWPGDPEYFTRELSLYISPRGKLAVLHCESCESTCETNAADLALAMAVFEKALATPISSVLVIADLQEHHATYFQVRAGGRTILIKARRTDKANLTGLCAPVVDDRIFVSASSVLYPLLHSRIIKMGASATVKGATY